MILTALALYVAEPPERWLHVGGDRNDYQEYVDSQSIRRSGDSATLWTRRDLSGGAGTMWHELEFDCSRRTQTVLAFIKDDGTSVSHNEARPHRPASPISPGSAGEEVFNIACR